MKKKGLNRIKKAVLNLSSKKVLQNLTLVSGATLFVSLIAFIKEAVVAANYGLNLQLDTFFIALLIPGLIHIVFLGSYKSVFIPNYINESYGKGDIKGFQTTSFIITFLSSVFFILLAILSTDIFLEVLFPNKSIEFYNQVKEQFYIILPSIIFWGFSSMFGALLFVNNEYKFSSFSDIFTPLCIISGFLIFSSNLPKNILAYGTLIGSVISCIYLFTIGFNKKIISIGTVNLKNENIKLTLKQLPAKVSSALLTSLIDVVDKVFAAQLVIGSIAALNYGLKIPAFLTNILLIAFSNVLLPYFSKLVLSDKEKAFSTLFVNLKRVFFALIFVTLIGIFLSDFIVELLFQRKEFTSEHTKTVATIQQILLAYIPFKITGMIMVNFLTSINKNSFMAYVSLGALILNIILDYILMKFYGIFGIALSTTIITVIRSITFYFYLIKLQRSHT